VYRVVSCRRADFESLSRDGDRKQLEIERGTRRAFAPTPRRFLGPAGPPSDAEKTRSTERDKKRTAFVRLVVGYKKSPNTRVQLRDRGEKRGSRVEALDRKSRCERYTLSNDEVLVPLLFLVLR